MKNNTTFKQTEIGMIPSDWEVRNIVENSTMKARIGWQGLTVSEYLDKGDYLLITGTDFVNGKIKWDSCHFVEKSRYDQDKNIQIKEGDILITKDGTIGKIAFVDELPLPSTLNSGVFVIRPKKNDNYLPKFLFYIFNSLFFNDFLNRLTAGSTIVHLYQKDFTSFSFPLPPTLAEQKAIATALNDADALIQKLEQLIAKKRNIKTGAMQELLKPKKGWEMKMLGEIALFYKGKGLAKSQINTDGKTKCIHYGELFIKYKEQITEVTGKTNAFEGAFYSKVNDVLMPTSDVTPNGLATASCLNEDDVILGGDVLVIRIPNSIVNGSFLSYFIKLNRNEIMKLVKGVTVFHLHASDMKDFILHYPKIEEQNKIAQILFEMEIEIQSMESQLEKYKMIKQGMMQNLLTGKIRLI